MAIYDDLTHLLKIIEVEQAKSKQFQKEAKQYGDIDDWNYYKGSVGAFNFSINKLKKLITAYKPKSNTPVRR